MGIEIEINAGWAFYTLPAVLNGTPAIAGDVHPGAEGEIFGVGCYGTVLRHEIPGEEDQADGDHPRSCQTVHGKKTFPWFIGHGAAGGQAVVGSTGPGAGAYIAIPEIEFQPSPTASLPTAADGAAAIGSGVEDLGGRRLGATTKENKEKDSRKHPKPPMAERHFFSPRRMVVPYVR